MTNTDTIETPDQIDRPSRRRPFSSWMKKLAHLKPSSSITADGAHAAIKKRNGHPGKSHTKKANISKNINPYLDSACMKETPVSDNIDRSSITLPRASESESSLEPAETGRLSEEGMLPPTIENKSSTMTSTGRACSEIAPSHAPSSGQVTNGTAGCGLRGNDSTFSSPAPSVRSLTTTLTTLHSVAPTTLTTNHTNVNHLSTQFTHQFPSSPPIALPPHMMSYGCGNHPSNYNTATANNLLTDDASILTLASSSKHGRRRSMDTDASVRALAPSSLFGGSRESLPLSILSANIETSTHQQRPSLGGMNERGSIYSTGGVSPLLLSNERNSLYAGKQPTTTDGGSIGVGILQNSPLIISRDILGTGSVKSIPPETIRDQDT